jgi:hypothetical protein
MTLTKNFSLEIWCPSRDLSRARLKHESESLQHEHNCSVATKCVSVLITPVAAWANLLGSYKARFCWGLFRWKLSQIALLLQSTFVFWFLPLQLEPICSVATKLVLVLASLITAWANSLCCYKAHLCSSLSRYSLSQLACCYKASFCSGLSHYSLSQLARLLQSAIVFWPLTFQREQTRGVASRRVCVLTYKGKFTSFAVTWYGSARSIFCHNLLSSIFKANRRGNE